MKPTKLSAEGEDLLPDSSNYDKNAYEKPSVTVDIAICRYVEGEVQVLLIKRKHNPFQDMWAIPGGFVNIPAKESLEETAARELKEETQVTGIFFEQLKGYGDPDRDPRMRVITQAYYALASAKQLAKQNIKAADDAKEYGWFSLRKLPKLAFDHKKILNDLLERLAGKVTYVPIAFELLDKKKFTWSELQGIYEFLLNRKIPAGNFRRKLKSMYIFKEQYPVKDIKSKGRPANRVEYLGVYDTLGY